MIGVDDIVEAGALSIPKTAAKTVETARQRFLPSVIELTADPQGIQPQRLNFHRLADAWRYNPVAHLGVHPCELHARNARREQPILIHVDAVARASQVATQNGGDG